MPKTQTRANPPLTTNTEKVERYMQFGSPLNQAFVMEAISRYAKQCLDNADSLRQSMANTMIHPEAWLQCAEDWFAENPEQKRGK